MHRRRLETAGGCEPLRVHLIAVKKLCKIPRDDKSEKQKQSEMLRNANFQENRILGMPQFVRRGTEASHTRQSTEV